MNKLVLGFLLMLSGQRLWALDCLVVSGLKHDSNDAFISKKILVPSKSVVAGKECKIFESWTELQKYTDETKGLGPDLLIIQGAHGGLNYELNDVTFSCDAETATADGVLIYLSTLSQKYQVGAVINSCYSGEMMRKKLINDQLGDISDQNLCLYTSSTIGRTSYSDDKDFLSQLETVKPGQTMEDIFLQVDAGMISSAAWNEIDLPQYLVTRSLEMGNAAIQNMDTITRGAKSCDDLFSANVGLCSAPGITDEIFEDLMYFSNPRIPENTKGFYIQSVENKTNKLKKELETNPGNKVALQGYNCFSKILLALQKPLGEKLEDVDYWPDLIEVFHQIGQMSFAPECESYRSTLPTQEEKDSFYYGPFYNGVTLYQEAIDRLQRRYTQRKFDDSFNLVEFTNAALGEKKICDPSSKQQIIQSMFGDSFFFGEYSSNFENTSDSPDQYTDPAVSTQKALKGFQNASLQKEDMLHPKDKKRREACRNFKF